MDKEPVGNWGIKLPGWPCKSETVAGHFGLQIPASIDKLAIQGTQLQMSTQSVLTHPIPLPPELPWQENRVVFEGGGREESEYGLNFTHKEWPAYFDAAQHIASRAYEPYNPAPKNFSNN